MGYDSFENEEKAMCHKWYDVPFYDLAAFAMKAALASLPACVILWSSYMIFRVLITVSAKVL